MRAQRAVALLDIVDDARLAYRDGLAQWPGAEALRASVRRCGVLQPLLLQESQAGFRAVSGFRRLALARELGIAELPAEVAGSADDTFALFVRAIEEHAAQPINQRERLRALQAAEQLGATPARLCAELLPALGLAPEPRLFEDLVRLKGLPPALLDLLAAKGFSLRRCLPFTRLDPRTGELLAGLARRLALGGRPLEELLTALLEISARDGQPLTRLLAELGPTEPESAAAELVARIEERRYPEASRRRRSLEEASARLRALGEVELRWDPALASEALELTLRLRSVDELGPILRTLGGEATRQVLRRAFEAL